MPLDICPVCGESQPDGPGDEVLKIRVGHMKTHGYDFSYLLGVREYVEARLELARKNLKNPMFWSGHANGVVSALEDVLDYIKRRKT